jgi:hypothetical protein
MKQSKLYFSFSFFLKKKETKIQGETPTPILFPHKKPAQYHRKNCSSLRFAKSNRTITNVCSSLIKVNSIL